MTRMAAREHSRYFYGWRLGLLLNLGCTVTILLDSILAFHPGESLGDRKDVIALATGGLLTFAALLLNRTPRFSQGLLLAGLILALYFGTSSIHFIPSLGYLFIVAVFLISAVVLRPSATREPALSDPQKSLQLLTFLSVGALANWMLVFVLNAVETPAANLAVIVSSYFCATGLFHFVRIRLKAKHRFFHASIIALPLALLLACYHSADNIEGISAFSIFVPLGGLFFAARSSQARHGTRNLLASLFTHADGALILCFLVLCGIGTLILYSPISHIGNQPFIDILFTAVSAVCITGLTVLDVSKDFTLFGQVAILILIQLGGLGIMTLSSLAIYIFGDAMSLKHEKAITSVYGQKFKGEIRRVLNSVFLLTFSVELIGALVLALTFFERGTPPRTALWNGLFTSISAFCNAGFSIQPNGFRDYQNAPLILVVTSILVIIGGLSPGFIFGLGRLRKPGSQNLQHTIIASTTVILLALGTLLFLAFESDRTMDALPFGSKVANAFFFSAISRTAGFDSIAVSQLSPATLFCLLFFMFVGGSPGGTAGGIKTTCLVVILITLFNTIRGRSDVVIHSRRVDSMSIRRAFAVFTMALGVIFIATLSLLVTQRLSLLQALFEIVSAFATVGLSMDVTPTLDSAGKLIVMVCMFIGRVGILAVFFYLVEHQKPIRPRVPTEDITVA